MNYAMTNELLQIELPATLYADTTAKRTDTNACYCVRVGVSVCIAYKIPINTIK